ncbi:RdgB/HAM1 family non-canonical purine NTP pyrophosphatase [Pasteuria penetrans]|uniref:RdgB/HAM1 family non-canonical purine NTP pyrophosphatase n=1 Tax=Pasteuria penetrans TaxID=86005 RepID=UPI000FA7FCF5|nr:RdgB/HAM1 family non-canonical purine NTP pyrophosphatase [Pasteuria penetrans]
MTADKRSCSDGGGSPTSLVFATHNHGKLQQVQEYLRGSLSLPIRGLGSSTAPLPEVEETGTTFAENAWLKAKTIGEALGAVVIADDSGLVVPVLGGQPGVFSARYAGEGATDEENCEKVLAALADVHGEARCATFVCALALYRPGSRAWIMHGVCHGFLLREPLGLDGFGYDPLFYYPPLRATFASLPREECLAVSHRGQVLRAFSQHWKESLASMGGRME